MSAGAIVGAAQVVQRPGDWTDPADARGPIQLMVDAARAAAEDAAAPGLLAQVGWIGVAGGWFRYKDPARLVAAEIGAPDAKTALAAISGSAPQEMVGLAARRIAAGELDVALIVGGEARWSAQRMQRDGVELPWSTSAGEGDPEAVSGFDTEMLAEMAQLGAPAVAYALFEDSLRVAEGTSVADHRQHMAELWARMSAVAADNPWAWDRTAHTADEVATATPQNRMIAFPYTKAMVANNTVDMASAVILCSAEKAATLGISADRLVFPHVVTTSRETWRVAERRDLHGCPALTAAGQTALDHCGIDIDDVAHVDLYACFPAIVQLSAKALGLSLDRQLTVTGGLGFAAAPIGNAVGHSIAAMVQVLRGGGYGLVHGNGGNATKHSFGVYANVPPASFTMRDVQDEVDLQPRPVFAADATGPATVAAATVVYDREGPSHVSAAVDLPSGERGLVSSKDADLIAAVLTDGLTGTSVVLAGDGTALPT